MSLRLKRPGHRVTGIERSPDHRDPTEPRPLQLRIRHLNAINPHAAFRVHELMQRRGFNLQRIERLEKLFITGHLPRKMHRRIVVRWWNVETLTIRIGNVLTWKA